MTNTELFKKHKEEKCSICKINKDCEIHITRDGKTRCTYDEMFKNESSVFGAKQKV